MIADIYQEQNQFFDPEKHRIGIEKEFVSKDEMENFKVVDNIPNSIL